MAASDDDNAILRELARSEYHLASYARLEALPSVSARHQRLVRRASAACIEGQYNSGQRGYWNRTKPTLLPDTVAAAILALAVNPPTYTGGTMSFIMKDALIAISHSAL